MADRPKFKDCMKLLLENSYGFAFEKYNGNLALARIDVDGTTVGTIDDSDVLLKSNKTAARISYTDIDNTITGIVIKYQRVHADNNYYGASSFCHRISSSETIKHNWTLLDANGNWQFYSSLLQTSYEQRNTDNILTIEADGIRDASTAERLARAIVLQRWKPMAIIDIDCLYTCLKYEIGDQVALDIGVLEANGLNDKIYLIVQSKISPTVGGSPMVSLKLIEIGAANLPESETWQDTYSTGDTKQNTYATGSVAVGSY